MQPLSTLPNREGFKFRGIRKDGGKFMNCRLKHLPGTGMFIVAAGRYVYEDVSSELVGWEPHPKPERWRDAVSNYANAGMID
jgi:hypothetical protein